MKCLAYTKIFSRSTTVTSTVFYKKLCLRKLRPNNRYFRIFSTIVIVFMHLQPSKCIFMKFLSHKTYVICHDLQLLHVQVLSKTRSTQVKAQKTIFQCIEMTTKSRAEKCSYTFFAKMHQDVVSFIVSYKVISDEETNNNNFFFTF